MLLRELAAQVVSRAGNGPVGHGSNHHRFVDPLRTRGSRSGEEPGGSDGVSTTALVRWAPDTRVHPHAHAAGEEILVLDGVFRDEFGVYPAASWLHGTGRAAVALQTEHQMPRG